MQSFIKDLLFNPLAPGFYNDFFKSSSKIYFWIQTEDIVFFGAILNNLNCTIPILQNSDCNNFEGNTLKAVIIYWICHTLQLLLLLTRNISKKIQIHKKHEILNEFIVFGFFIIQCVIYYPQIDMIKNLIQTNFIDEILVRQAFWLGIDVMFWSSLLFIITNLLFKLLMGALIFIYISILFSINSSCIISFQLQLVTMLVTYAIGIYLMVKKNKFIHDKLVEKEVTWLKIMNNLPQSMVIFDENTNLLFSNISFAKLVKSKEPMSKEFLNLINSITHLKLRGAIGFWVEDIFECTIADTQEEKNKLQNGRKEEMMKLLFSDSSESNSIALTLVIKLVQEKLSRGLETSNDSCMIIQGRQGTQEFEMKIILVDYFGKKSILLTLSNITYHNFITKLEDNKKYKSLLLSSFSHELNTPLNGSISLLESALDNEFFKKNSIGQLVLSAFKNLKLLESIINDVLDYTMLLKKELNLNLFPVNIRKLTSNVASLMEFQIKMKETIKLNILIDSNIPEKITTDARRYSQILICLLGNACKFTFKGSITINIKFSIKVNALKVSVIDTGIGLEGHSIEKLRNLFISAQEDYSEEKITENSTGCALGLSIASALSKYLGPINNDMEYFKVKSIFGKGSKFTFFLENKVTNRFKIDIPKDKYFLESFKNLQSSPLNEINKKKHNKVKARTVGDTTNSNPNIQLRAINEIQLNFENNHEYIDNFELKAPPNIIVETLTEKYKLSSGIDKSENLNDVSKSSGCNQGVQSSIIEHTGSYKFVDKKGIDDISANLFNKFPKDKKDLQIIIKDLEINLHKTILIVDDDSLNILSLELMFKSLKITSLTAYNGKQAIEKCIKNQNIDIIFMDCNMPVMDGWEATQRLKQLMEEENIRQIPIIACTAYCDEKSKQKCYDAGMEEIVSKPLSKAKIIDILKKYDII